MATANKVGSTTFTTPSDREVVMTRVFDAPRSLVWEAWTNPEHVPQWLLGPEGWTMPVCEIDLRPGGEWHFVWRRTDGTEMEMRGEYREITPPERLVCTESWGGDWPETLNTLILTEDDGKTTMTQTVLYPSKEARDAALETGMKEGASESFDRLAEHPLDEQGGHRIADHLVGASPADHGRGECDGVRDSLEAGVLSHGQRTLLVIVIDAVILRRESGRRSIGVKAPVC